MPCLSHGGQPHAEGPAPGVKRVNTRGDSPGPMGPSVLALLQKPLCRQGPVSLHPLALGDSRIQPGVGRHQSQSEAFGIAGAKPTPQGVPSAEPQPVGPQPRPAAAGLQSPHSPLGAPGPLAHPFSAFRTLAAFSIVLHRHTTDLPHFDF